jgi:hypothetical protein
VIIISSQNLSLNVIEESLYLYFVENNSIDFYQYLIRKYPDDFLKAGKPLRELSKQQKQYLISIFKEELKSS